MIRIDVTDELRTINFKTKSGGPGSFQVQTVYAHIVGNKYPVKTEVAVTRDGQPLPAGEYTLSPDSIEVDPRGRLSLFPKLLRVKKAG